MRQHSYGRAPQSAHSATRIVDSYGVYHEPPRCNVNFQEPHNDRFRESCVGPEYHDTHITYTDPLRAERIPYNDDDGFLPQRAQLYRAGVVVNASGNSAVVRTSSAQLNNYVANNSTHSIQSNNYSATNNSHGIQETTNVQPNNQQAQSRNEENETENNCCCGCKGQRKTSSSTAGNSTSLWAIWCRPTILLLMLVLVASVFVLASGIMLYYHYIQQNRPSINSAPDIHRSRRLR